MYPLIELGPLRLSTGGLLLLLATWLWTWYFARVAVRRGGPALEDSVDRVLYPALIGAIIGGRLWYGLFNWDLYGRSPGLFLALRVGDLAWPGALLGGALAGYLWCRRRGLDHVALADSAALALPPAQALASLGLLFSGEVFGVPTDLPWGVQLFGVIRHPTQVYYVLAALLIWAALVWLARRQVDLPPGGLVGAYIGMQGFSMLLIEALRADAALLPGGVRVVQVAGLALMLCALLLGRRYAR